MKRFIATVAAYLVALAPAIGAALGPFPALATGPSTVTFPNSLPFGVTLGGGGEYHSTTALVDINNPVNGATISGGALSVSLQGTPTVALSGTTVVRDVAGMTGTVPGAAPTNTLIVGSIFNTVTPAPTNGQTLPLQSDSAGRLIVACGSGCTGSGGGAAGIADESTFTQGSTNFSPIGGFFNSSVTNLTSGQGGAAQLTPDRMLVVSLGRIGGTVPTTGGVNGSFGVGGLAASGATAAGNPLQIGAVFNTTQPTVTNGQAVQAQATARGALIVATGVDALAASQSGTWTVAASQSGTWTVATNADGSAGGGAAGSKSLLTGCQFNTTAPTLTNGQQGACQSDTNGNIKITGGLADASSATGVLYSPIAGRGSTGIQKFITCDKYAKYDASTAGDTQVIALSGSTVIYICGYSIHVGGTATNVKLDYGTGTNCATGITALTPAWQLVANAGRVAKSAFWDGLSAPSGNAVCVNASAANAVQAELWYAQF